MPLRLIDPPDPPGPPDLVHAILEELERRRVRIGWARDADSRAAAKRFADRLLLAEHMSRLVLKTLKQLFRQVNVNRVTDPTMSIVLDTLAQLLAGMERLASSPPESKIKYPGCEASIGLVEIEPLGTASGPGMRYEIVTRDPYGIEQKRGMIDIPDGPPEDCG